ncbi:MAG: hypothetical protein D8M57_05575 [Candidatus Scalindua sp. AMX11]|nr:MAG: hypothetical protein DWQ00_07210 [Candidatus Scalindua sp.]NOG85923.1 hypothetical protein [Planctomycetota bacterium]RZV91442.1 MAG: hypothetical protein EX341_05830 [Candidatus Scalindua sp. SCAELEC01]TDE66003.1 MAG: hypothetical protein D8M57_05575 [Candidatus Scalindua sp. AMX11]GJQ59312.1 MAG: hypothetical protein SCALA701_21130 [Candidatus Scalindua sp.]
MKKVKKEDELKPEYKRSELGKGVRGKYYESYKSSHNLVLLNPEVASAFPTEQAVNKALMSLIVKSKTAKTLTKKSS